MLTGGLSFPHHILANDMLNNRTQLLKQLLQQQIAPSAFANAEFNDFSFRSSSSGSQYNNYDGQSQNFSLGEISHKIGKRLEAGASLHGGFAKSSGRSFLTGGTPNGFNQATDSLGVRGRLTFKMSAAIPAYLTLFANYINNHTRTTTIINEGLATEQRGNTTYDGHNLNFGFNIKRHYITDKWLFLAAAGYAYATSSQNPYTVNVAGININTPSLTMSQHNFTESIQAYYQYKPNIVPYTSISFNQGLDRRYNRNVNAAVLSSSVNAPRFQTSLYGVVVGGGVTYQYKQFAITPSYHYQAQGKEFHNHAFALQAAMKLY